MRTCALCKKPMLPCGHCPDLNEPHAIRCHGTWMQRLGLWLMTRKAVRR